jgi:photosystem II stability/assembly factor-like uncharacterized protein
MALSSWWVIAHPRWRADVSIPNVQSQGPYFKPGWWANLIEFQPSERLPKIEGDLLSISFTRDSNFGWMLGARNTLLRTVDGGGTWARVKGPTIVASPPYKATLAPPFNTNVSAGVQPNNPPQLNAPSNVRIGISGPDAKPPEAPYLRHIAFRDSERGYGLMSDGTLLSTDDGGEKWQHVSYIVVAASVGDKPGSEKILRGDGTLAGADGTPKMRIRETFRTKVGLAVFPAAEEFALVEDTVVSSWRGSTLLEQATIPFDAEAISSAGDNGVWIVGLKGNVIRSDDRCVTWSQVQLPINGNYRGICFANSETGWIVGEDGLVLRTVDGGSTWWRASRATQNVEATKENGRLLWLPPVWWWGAFFACSGLLWYGRKVRHVQPTFGIEDLLLSDRPLEAGEKDLLGHESYARGISAFLRNSRTVPPLTFAITGEWGCGKTSLMNLIRGDLTQRGFRPVWFNAWHHQTEEHLLAALLENIRSQAVPLWWDPRGIPFRFRLYRIRLSRNWGSLLPFACLLGCIVGIYATLPQGVAEQMYESPLIKYAALFGTTAVLLLHVARAARAFGVEPSSLLATISESTRVKDLRKQTSFRFHFAEEFADVSSALGVRRMVIFIDDVDRCRPQQVSDLLESANFLVSSGRCFIILALAVNRVERVMGLALQDVADAEKPPAVNETAQSASKRRSQYANRFLGKLINFEVHVPPPKNNQYAGLLRRPDEPHGAIAAKRYLRSLVHSVFATVTIVLIGYISFYGTTKTVSKWPPDGAKKIANVDQSAPSFPLPLVNQLPAKMPLGRDDTASIASFKPATFVPSADEATPLSWICSGLFIFLLLTFYHGRGTSRPEQVDSDEFIEALRLWAPFVAAAATATPRSLKRFANRVRFYAMLQTFVSDGMRIPEGVLVSLAALEERFPRVISADRPERAEMLAELQSSTDPKQDTEFLCSFSQIDEKFFTHFRELSAGVDFRPSVS